MGAELLLKIKLRRAREYRSGLECVIFPQNVDLVSSEPQCFNDVTLSSEYQLIGSDPNVPNEVTKLTPFHSYIKRGFGVMAV